MAQVPYAGGTADVQPDATPPDDYQRIEANPSSFGGAIAQGAEKLGAGATDMSKFWGHVQADDASNNAQKEASDLAEHIRTLQGQDALDAQKGAYKSLDDIYTKYRNQLGSPDQQLLYDNQNRPFFDRFIRGQMNTTFIDAGRTFATKTADAGIEVAHGMAATAGSDGNWGTVEVAYHKALSGEYKKLQTAGMESDPDSVAAAKVKAALVYKSGLEGMALKNPDGALTKLDDPKIKAALGTNYDATEKSVRESVARSYISKADALSVDDPTKAEAFVRANEAKFGPSYGAALDRAHEAANRAIGKGGGNSAWDAAAGGAPKTTPVSSNAQVYGDSLGEGVKTAYGLSGDTKVGRTPQQVYDTLHALPDGSLAGKPVVISTGASNSPKDVDFARNQIRTAIAKGADPAQLTVLGVGDRPDFAGVNDKLKEIAGQFGAKFQPVDPSKLSADRVHPASYTGLLGGAAVPRAPGAITTGPAANIDSSIPPEGRALLATIGGPEAGGQYNVRYGGAHFDGYADHPRIKQAIESGPNKGGMSDAAGRYQFLGSTWDEAKKALGLTDFSPASQDKAAWWLAQRDYHAKTGGDLTAALKSGDPEKLAGVAQALHGTWTSLPGGIEEGTTSGKFAASYSAALQGKGASTIASREPASYSARPVATSPDAAPESLETTKPTDAAFTPPTPPALQPPPPPQTPEDVVNAIYDQQSAALAHLKEMGLTPEQMIEGERQITQRAAFEIAAAGDQQRAIKAREDAATEDVLGTARKDGYKSAFEKLNAMMADPNHPISEKHFDALSTKLAQDSGDPNPKWVGPGYTEGIDRLLADRKDPRHIYSVRQLMELQDPRLTPKDKLITGKGFEELYKRMTVLDKNEGEAGQQELYKQGLAALEHKLNGGEINPLTGKSTNPYGLEIFQTAGVARYNAAFTAWQQAVKAGKADPTDFSLSDPKKLDAFATSIYPPSQRAYDHMRAGTEMSGDQALPAMAEGANPDGFMSVVDMAKSNKTGFAASLDKLASDPAKYAPIWDREGTGKVISAQAALQKMGVSYTPPQRSPITPEDAKVPTGLSHEEKKAVGVKDDDEAFIERLKAMPKWALEKMGIQVGPFEPENILGPAGRRDLHAARRFLGTEKAD